MRISDLFRLAMKTLNGRWAVLSAAGFAIAAFCLCFAGAISASVREEKAQPYEITVSAQGDRALTDSDVAELSKLEGVTAATAVLEVPANVRMGDNKAEWTLTGMDGGFIQGVYDAGGVYPPDTVMPYIVLNAAACKALSAGHGDVSMTEAPEIDWLHASFSVQTGEGIKPVAAKVCGVLAEDGEAEEPAAYISLSCAQTLLKPSGVRAGYGSLRVRVTDIGHAQRVSRGIAALGLTALDSVEELQAGWDRKTGEMTYLLALGGFCLVCAAVLAAAHRSAVLRRGGRALEACLWLGMRGRDVSRLFMLHVLVISAIGAAAGVLVGLALPSFLSAGLEGSSVFVLSLPWVAVLAGMGLCLVAGAISACAWTRRPPLA